MVPPSRGTSGAERLGGRMANSPGWPTLTSEHIEETGIQIFLGTIAYRRRDYFLLGLFPLSKFPLLYLSDKRL